jgi:hypothetical protein
MAARAKGQPRTSALADQLLAAAVGAWDTHQTALSVAAQAAQDAALDAALRETQKVRDFIGDPTKILGRADTKHGEIAEQTEVGVRNAWNLLMGDVATAFKDPARNGPVDIHIDGNAVQLKFINGIKNGLDHLLEHKGKYEDFALNGSGYYMLPKEQVAAVLAIRDGLNPTGMSDKSIETILKKVSKLEEMTGRPFEEVVKPSISTYTDVQQGRIEKTLDRHDGELGARNDELKDDIQVEYGPSVVEGLKATGAAAAVGATVGFVGMAYKKYRDEKKNIFAGEFDSQDWKDVRGEALQAGALGGLSGAAIYGMTRYADVSAPLAGAFVSAVKGLAPLVSDYRAGRISVDALVDGGMFVCVDVALVGLCSAAGQTLIPVPVLGAVLGSLAGKVLSSLISNQIEGGRRAIEEKMKFVMAHLDAEYLKLVTAINARFDKLGELAHAAFDLTTNERVIERSLDLARAYGVSDSKLLHSVSELDDFMTS